MAFEFKLPDIGEGLTEGEVVKWLVKEGDTVAGDQPMVEVMTDKATVEITSPRAGVIERIVAPEGQKIPVGSVMVVIGDGSGGGKAAAKPAASPPAAKAAPAPAAKAPAAPAAAAAPENGAEETAAPEEAEAPAPAAAAAPSQDARSRTLAAPATRKRAREAGVDLNAVPATGPHGRLTRTDLERWLSQGARPAAGAAAAPARPSAAPPRVPVAAVAASAEDEHVPLRGVRGKIAEQMTRSKQYAPHFTYADECDVTELVALREQAKPIAAERGVKLTYLPFIMKALVACFRKFPTVNALVDDTKHEFVIRRDYNVGLATDTEEGLMVPVVKHVDRRSVLEIAAEIQRLTEAARSKKVHLEDLKGGTFTITSAGSIGGFLATPILNYPEVAILGVYRIQDKPVVRDGQIVIRKMTMFSITLDHRIVDGATAARFLNELIRLLSSPGLLLLEGV
jgi:pyruvate dehydrogenase E2 component (dihydrolipoamide acetyltransferase)